MVSSLSLGGLLSFEGNCIDCIRSVNTHAPLDTSSGYIAQSSSHVLLLMQIFSALVNVVESVDGFSGNMRCCSTKILSSWIPGCIKGQPHYVKSALLTRIESVDLFTVRVKVMIHFA